MKFQVDFSALIHGRTLNHPIQARLTNISLSGARILSDSGIPSKGSDLFLSFRTDRYAQITVPIREIVHQRKLVNGQFEAGLWFGEVEGEIRRKLFEVLFVDLPQVKYGCDSVPVGQRLLNNLTDFVNHLGWLLRKSRNSG